MPGFRRPFPSRKWLKLSLEEAQREASYNKMVADNIKRIAGESERELIILRAQAATQAATIGEQDEQLEAARLRIAFLEQQARDVAEAKCNWAENIASLRRELEAAEAAAVIAHKRADAWEVEATSLRRYLSQGNNLRVARLLKLISVVWTSRRRYQDMPPCEVPGHTRGSWEDDQARIWWCPDCGDEMRLTS